MIGEGLYMKKYVKSNTVDREYLYDRLQYAVDILGADYVLDEFSRHMSSDELKNYLDILYSLEELLYEK